MFKIIKNFLSKQELKFQVGPAQLDKIKNEFLKWDTFRIYEYGIEFTLNDEINKKLTLYIINCPTNKSKFDYFKLEMFDFNLKSNSNQPINNWYDTPYYGMLDAILNENKIEFEGVFDSFTVWFSDLRVTQMEELNYDSELKGLGYLKSE